MQNASYRKSQSYLCSSLTRQGGGRLCCRLDGIYSGIIWLAALFSTCILGPQELAKRRQQSYNNRRTYGDANAAVAGCSALYQRRVHPWAAVARAWVAHAGLAAQ